MTHYSFRSLQGALSQNCRDDLDALDEAVRRAGGMRQRKRLRFLRTHL